MRNFFRAVTLALRYRWSLIGILLSSTIVAVFWGANLGTVYPIVEVVLKGRSLHKWAEDSIRVSQDEIAELTTQLQSLDDTLRTADVVAPRQAKRQRALLVAQLDAEQSALATTVRLQPWIQRYLPDRPFATLVIIICFLMAGTFFKSVFLIVNVILVERVTQLAAFDLRKLFYRRTLSMNLANFAQDRTSELLSRFTHDVEGITDGIKTVFGRSIREPLKIVACLIGAGWICWRLLLFCLIVTPVSILVINRLAQSVKRANRRAMEEMSHLYRHLSESLNGIQAVKAFTMERHERRRFHHVGKNYLRRKQRIATYNVLTRSSAEVMSIGVVCLALLVGGYLVLDQETHLFGIRMSNRPLSFGSLMAFFALLAGVSDPFRKLAEVFNQIQRGVAAADRIYALADRQPAIENRPDPKLLPMPLQKLELDEVFFHYQPDCPVLNGVSLAVEAGETLAIVGPNGCGKSSLANLIPRFYDPTSGSVKWNGVDLRDVRIAELRGRIGLVTQHTMLFDETIMNNIRYGSLQATEDNVVEAARKARAHQFITQQLADGYDTVVGQSGCMLSGGQRQRLALARAILRDPEVLILDEATSQIDLESEQLIHQTLREFTRERTTILITHRLSTLALASRILVLDNGRIADLGTHTQLLARCPLYRSLHEADIRKTSA